MSINPNCKIDVVSIDHIDVLIIDDFLADPMEMRKFAIAAHGKAPLRRQAPKAPVQRRKKGPVDEIWMALEIFDNKFPGVRYAVAEQIDVNIGKRIRQHFDLPDENQGIIQARPPFFHSVYGLPRFLPHVDTGHISSFLYLNSPQLCKGGTGIYRHVPTNAIHADQTDTTLDWLAQKPLEKNLTESTEEWKLELMVEMKFNRLVAFNSSVIHKIYWPDEEQPFKQDIRESRLTLNNFFYYAETKDGEKVDNSSQG